MSFLETQKYPSMYRVNYRTNLTSAIGENLTTLQTIMYTVI